MLLGKPKWGEPASPGLFLLRFCLLSLCILPSTLSAEPATFVSGYLSAASQGQSQTVNIPSVPFADSITYTATDISSATQVDLTLSSYVFTINQSVSTSAYTAGTAEVQFTVATPTEFNLAYTYTVSASTASELVVYSIALNDLSNSSALFNLQNQSGTGSGAAVGALTPGTTYEFIESGQILPSADPGISVTSTLTLGSPVPENPAPLIPFLLAGFVLLRNRFEGRRNTGRSYWSE